MGISTQLRIDNYGVRWRRIQIRSFEISFVMGNHFENVLSYRTTTGGK